MLRHTHDAAVSVLVCGMLSMVRDTHDAERGARRVAFLCGVKRAGGAVGAGLRDTPR